MQDHEPIEVEELLRRRYAALCADDYEAPLCDRTELLARIVGDEASVRERREFEAHWPDCEDCRPAWEALAPAEPRRTFRAPRPQRWRGRVEGLVAGALIAAVAVMAIRPAPVEPPEPTPLTPKGALAPQPDRLGIVVKRGEQRWRAVPGETLRAGDVVGLVYTSDSPGHLIGLHVDEAGEVTVLAPTDGTVGLEIGAGRDVLLSEGGVLEAGAGCEWFVAVFSETALTIADAVDAVRAARPDSARCMLQPGVEQARAVVVFPIRR